MGAGDGPSVILMTGTRSNGTVRYPVSAFAARYGASADEETTDPEQAYAYSRIALRLASRVAAVREAAGFAAYATQKYSEALAEFRATLEHDPDSAEAWISIGQVLQRRKDADGSTKAFAEADRLRKKKADQQAAAFAVSTGAQKLASGDVNAALSELQQALRLAPDNPQVHYQLARALERAGRSAEARTHFDEARRLWPKPVTTDAPH